MAGTRGPIPPGGGHRLSLNEMPDVPVAELRELVQASLREVNRYPDPFSGRLTGALADLFSVPESEVVVGSGAASLLQCVIQWAAPHEGEVVYAWPSFDVYRLVVESAGAVPVEVPLRQHRHDLPQMLDRITHDTRALVLCNPHNPTGTVLDTAEMLSFLRKVPQHVVVVLDEAYREFAGDHDTPDGGEIYRDVPNLVVLRSFSKAYGLAGLRVGFALARRDVAEALRGRVLPFAVSTVAEAAARTALSRRSDVLRQIERVVAERDRLTGQLVRHGLAVVPSAANFLWLPIGSSAPLFAERAARDGLHVRAVHEEGVRVTVGGVEANDAFLRFALRWVRRHME
ncbi:aminotransferase class I/II-fold pyridoxal phosphate-dependent enzyme [Streptomyces sp. NPDC005438]|uniref:aminotransferase class I/II-fold pyridoxal phosphate-dependent enzyme n=1 Tax=Streptomyces sp. NPDC005438 TaxID=3156880 RepID=UPI0033BE1E4C